MSRPRLRDTGLALGRFPTGTHNAITDVPGVIVGHTTILKDEPVLWRTGLTVISPKNGAVWHDHVFAATYAFNGFGEASGSTWIEESGLLCSPIVLTGTTAVGSVHRAMQKFALDNQLPFTGFFPVIFETADTWLNPPEMSPITSLDVYQAMSSARGGPVPEGNVGGGTGMTCHEFKGGIGTASRILSAAGEEYVLGALVQSNHGRRDLLRVNGLPLGGEIGADIVPVPMPIPGVEPKGSIIVVLATNAPLIPIQLKRLAQRATLGLARSGGLGENWSGDIFLAFATGNDIPSRAGAPVNLRMLPHTCLDVFFEGAAEAVEEAILNSLLAATTMTGYDGRTAFELPVDRLRGLLAKFDSMHMDC